MRGTCAVCARCEAPPRVIGFHRAGCQLSQDVHLLWLLMQQADGVGASGAIIGVSVNRPRDTFCDEGGCKHEGHRHDHTVAASWQQLNRRSDSIGS